VLFECAHKVCAMLRTSQRSSLTAMKSYSLTRSLGHGADLRISQRSQISRCGAAPHNSLVIVGPTEFMSNRVKGREPLERHGYKALTVIITNLIAAPNLVGSYGVDCISSIPLIALIYNMCMSTTYPFLPIESYNSLHHCTMPTAYLASGDCGSLRC
jgi:hypothetical protein